MADIQQLLQESLQTYLDPQSSSVALGITFGIKNALDKQFAEEIKIVGISHMMVLSGANISMFMNFIGSIVYFVPSKTREVIVIVGVLVFLTLIPLQPSIVRAALMSIIPRIGVVLGKESHSMYLLLLTCALILCFDIHYLYDISFQLSFLAVFGILLFYKESQNTNTNIAIVRNIIGTIRNQALLGFSAQVFTVPLIFLYFGNISLISPLTNLVLAPLVSPIMVVTIVLFLVGSVFPAIGTILGFLLKILIACMVQVIQIFSKADFLYIRY